MSKCKKVKDVQLAALAACMADKTMCEELGIKVGTMQMYIDYARRYATHPETLDRSYKTINRSLGAEIRRLIDAGEYTPKYKAKPFLNKPSFKHKPKDTTQLTFNLKEDKAPVKVKPRVVTEVCKNKLSPQDAIQILDKMFETIKETIRAIR